MAARKFSTNAMERLTSKYWDVTNVSGAGGRSQ